MAWIELHQTLPQNKKTLRLTSILRIDTPQAIGHLCMLWLWALDNAQDGNLEPFLDAELAQIAGWKKKPEDFINALISAGFLSKNKVIHDWYDYAGKLIEKRKDDAERKRTVRGQSPKYKGQSKGCPTDIQETTAISSADGAGNRTLPYLTVPNHTVISESDNVLDSGRSRFTPPTEEEVIDYCRENNFKVDAAKFFCYYSSKGWKVGVVPMEDWKAKVREWDITDSRQDKPKSQENENSSFDADEFFEVALDHSMRMNNVQKSS